MCRACDRCAATGTESRPIPEILPAIRAAPRSGSPSRPRRTVRQRADGAEDGRRRPTRSRTDGRCTSRVTCTLLIECRKHRTGRRFSESSCRRERDTGAAPTRDQLDRKWLALAHKPNVQDPRDDCGQYEEDRDVHVGPTTVSDDDALGSLRHNLARGLASHLKKAAPDPVDAGFNVCALVHQGAPIYRLAEGEPTGCTAARATVTLSGAPAVFADSTSSRAIVANPDSS